MSSVAAAEVDGVHRTLVRDLFALTKPRITALVVFTAAGGLWLAPEADRPSIFVMAISVLATAMVVSAANALNCWYERDTDALMNRTRRRPLPAGRISSPVALAFGLALAVVSLAMLTFLVNPLAGLLAFIAFVSYVWIYTPMKRMSSDALLVGAVPGALPPLIGWVSATNRIDLPGLVLFAILFVWQLPHFLAIAILCEEDYARGGHKVFPVVRGERAARYWTVIWSAAQLVVSLLPVFTGLAGWAYGVVALLSGAAFLAYAIDGLRRGGGKPWARRLMLASVIWLAVIFAALMLGAP
ncbi:MAG TPA: heme o synthase [Vulgatibacter sp.]|nr:heme o synthase [Vulgatibacter sp.]